MEQDEEAWARIQAQRKEWGLAEIPLLKVWKRIILEARQVLIGGTSQGNRMVSPVAIMEGRGTTLIHVHIDDEDFEGKTRMRSYSYRRVWLVEEREPGTATEYAMGWNCPVDSRPCPGQTVKFRRPL